MTIFTQHKSLHCPFPATKDELSSVLSFVRLSCMSFACTDAQFISAIEHMAQDAFSNLLEKNSQDSAPSKSIIVECTKGDTGVVLSLFDEGTSYTPQLSTYAADEMTFTPKNDTISWNQLSLFKKYRAV